VETVFVVGIGLLLLVLLILQILLLRRQTSPALDLTPLHVRTEAIERAQERTERGLREELSRNREEEARESRNLRQDVVTATQQLRTELSESLKAFNDSVVNSITGIAAAQAAELARLGESTDQKFEAVRSTVQERLKILQDENMLKLEQIRRTVDEQLQTTLEKRLGESFKIVSERLEQVHRGLGEMQALAAGVGDLKKLLSNVRTRGTWGEVQLGMLLEQMLTPDQYGTNVATTGTGERVEFAVKLPGAEQDGCVWLPIDAKFPKEDYERLMDAVDRADAAVIAEASRQLEIRARQCAKDITQKYVEPPTTTDFAIMYLATEGLYAEVLRRPGLIEVLQREHRVTVAGPMTLAAILNSLQMGFRTLAIQKRSSEVWEVLGTVKTEFGTYADILAKVQKKLQEASNTVDAGLTRTRAIQRKLKDVQELPSVTAEISPSVDIEELRVESVGAGEGPD
jgi:DNA recombination protein RmuC